MDRRGFLGSILAACVAPAIVRADSLMRVIPTDTLTFGYAEMTLTIEEFGEKYGYSAAEDMTLLTPRLITIEALKILAHGAPSSGMPPSAASS